MKRRKLKQLSLVLALVMVVSLVVPTINFVEKPLAIDGETELKNFTVSDEELREIASVAKDSGIEAAAKVNELKGDDFEAAVNKVLTEYYKKGEKNRLEEFKKNVNSKAANIVKGYEEAADERAKAEELPYEVGTSLLTFDADISKQEIKDIVKDQYGECEYIYECTDGTYIVKVKNSLGLTVDKAVDAYGEYKETVCTARNDKVEQIAEAYEVVNDTYAANQYYLRTMNVVDTWQYIRGVNHSKVKVAVIDGGADLNSADLQASASLSVAIQSDGSYIPLSQSSPMYNNSHGTGVAGVLAGTANNGTQIAGVASCINNDVAELINVKIEMYVDKIALGLDYARQAGAKVANLSLAHEGSNDVEEAAINNFVAAGGTVVAGAGNNGSDVSTYPSDYANVISVISVDESYNIAGTSNRGWNKDICAPGVAIYAPNITGSGSDTIITGGTSFASPMVAAVVTMMYSVNSGLNSSTVRNILIDTAKDLGETGRDYTYAYGFVNAYAAVVSAAGGTVVETTTAASTSGPQEVFGQVVKSNANNHINVVWGSNTAMEQAGQTYNVYVDDTKVLSNVVCGSYDLYDISAGTHTVKITAVYNGSETSGVTAQVTVAGETATTTTVETTTATSTNIPTGYTTAGTLWTNLNYWSVYFASGWANDPTGSYKDGGSYNDFGVYVDKASGENWGIQLKTQVLSTTIGKTYICKVSATFNSNMADTITFKDEGTQVSKSYTLVNGTNNFEIEFTPTADNTQIFIGLGKVPAGGNFVITSFSIEEKQEATTEEPTTQEETTTAANAIDGGIEINGYQISATVEGMRVVYSVDSEINGKKVESSGLVYSLADYVGESELYVGSTNYYVCSYESTALGVLDKSYSSSDIATSYVMTMTFGAKTEMEYNANWRVRAYAKLSDGSYVYTSAYEYTIYDIADKLYQGCMMNTKANHEYLYNDILSVVNKAYEIKDYDWSSAVVR